MTNEGPIESISTQAGRPEGLPPANLAALSKAGVPIPAQASEKLFAGPETKVDPSALQDVKTSPEVIERHEKAQSAILGALLKRLGR